MASTATGTKYCCKCGTDVGSIQRMKDSGGRYWCLPCGKKDQQQKAANTGSICGGCGEMFPASQMTNMSGSPYCAKCLKKKFKNSGGGGGGGLSAILDISRYLPSGGSEEDDGRKKKMTIMLVLLVALIVAVNYWLH